LLDGDLRGLDLRMIRFLKSKRQTSACPLIMDLSQLIAHVNPFFSASPAAKKTRRSWQCNVLCALVMIEKNRIALAAPVY
jgi:hypothetical protein